MVHSEREQGRGQRSRRSFLFTRLGATLHIDQNLQNIVQKSIVPFSHSCQLKYDFDIEKKLVLFIKNDKFLNKC